MVIQDKELPTADGEGTAIDVVPFFAGEDGLEGEASHMVVAMDFAAEGVEDHILLAESVEVGLLVKAGGAVVGKGGKVHAW